MTRLDTNDEKVKSICRSLKYSYLWDVYPSDDTIKKILNISSKNGSGNPGYPDFININPDEKLLVLVEIKPTIAKHKSPDDAQPNPQEYAVDGIIWYLERFLNKNISDSTVQEYLKDWKFVGIAASGNPGNEYNHLISTFTIIDQVIVEQPLITDIQNEVDYIRVFENIDEEELVNKVSVSSKKINKWLRSIESQKRPVLLSVLMICLFKIKGAGSDNSFVSEYNSNTPQTIVNKLEPRVKAVLESESIPPEKIAVLLAELQFIYHDNDIRTTDILKNILNELRDVIIPLFERKSNYDIIGKFYEDFLKWAGIANVKKGIVLTPSHITNLFTELIELKSNDVILDTCCGTGAFLISSMNRLVSTIQASGVHNKDEIISNVKRKQLIGFETSPLMYSLAISSMLFRGDGKSQIYNVDSFSDEADAILNRLKQGGVSPTIGFINPPYGGKDNKDNPTKKEIQFLTRLLDICSRYVVMIAPLSTYFKEESIRSQILEKHTLKAVINMPKDLFVPNASTNTAISIFETNIPQGDQKVVFYDMKDDGFILSKSKGRTDIYGKWNGIKQETLRKISKPEDNADGVSLVHTSIKKGDEWLIQDHSVIDYSTLKPEDFENSIKEHLIFKAKENMHLLGKDIDEVSLLNILSSFYTKDGAKNG
jgi:type I restriction enzyme M protein